MRIIEISQDSIRFVSDKDGKTYLMSLPYGNFFIEEVEGGVLSMSDSAKKIERKLKRL